MRRSWKRFLTIILLALSSLFVLAGCKIGKDSLDEILDKNELEAVVTYYANGGRIFISHSCNFNCVGTGKALHVLL
jgi:hypothetical protein